MTSLPRKTYDTDVLTVRRIFAYNPDTNAPISSGSILAVTGARGAASFINPLEISSFGNLSTLVGNGLFKNISTGNIGTSSITFIDSATGNPQYLIVSSAGLYLNNSTIIGSGYIIDNQLTSTVIGLGTAGYISTLSTNQLSTGSLFAGNVKSSTINLVDAANGSQRTLISSNDFLYYNGGIVNYATVNYNTSTYVYQVSSVSTLYAFTIPVVVSSVTNMFVNTDYYSSVSFSTGLLGVSSVNFVDTDLNVEQLLAVKNGQLLLNNQPIVADLTKENLFSTVTGLGTIGYISSGQLTSTTAGSVDNLFPPLFASTVGGLGRAGYISSFAQLTSTTGGLVNNLFPPFFASTVLGLGNARYISSSQLTSTTAGLVVNVNLMSTVGGLGLIGYISSSQLGSTVVGISSNLIPQYLASTVRNLGLAGYISSTQLTSTTAGLFTTSLPPFINTILQPFVSTPSLVSSITNLYVPFQGDPAGKFQVFAQSNTLNFGFSGASTSQIFIGDARRALAFGNTDPLIKISQDVSVNPRGADVLDILGGVNNTNMIKIDSNLNLGIGLSQASYNNSSGLIYNLQVDQNAFISSCLVDSLVANKYMATSSMMLMDSFSQFSSFGPATSNIRLALESGDAYKPTGATWKTLSDARIKENIVLADYGRCYDDLKKLPLRRFRYCSSFVQQAGVFDKTVLGFVAQELAQVMPKSVTQEVMYGFSDLNTISVDQINMAAVGALKKTIEDKEALESTTRGLITMNGDLSNQINQLRGQLVYIQEDFCARISTLEAKMIDIKNDLSMSHSIL